MKRSGTCGENYVHEGDELCRAILTCTAESNVVQARSETVVGAGHHAPGGADVALAADRNVYVSQALPDSRGLAIDTR